VDNFRRAHLEAVEAEMPTSLTGDDVNPAVFLCLLDQANHLPLADHQLAAQQLMPRAAEAGTIIVVMGEHEKQALAGAGEVGVGEAEHVCYHSG
jgi:hypothetical protein